MSCTIKESVAARLIHAAFDKKCNNSEYLVDFLFKSLTNDQLSQFIEVLHLDGAPKLPKIGDIIKYKLYKHDSFKYDEDILRDHNMFSDGYLFGVIIGDDGYGSDFNPWHYKMEANIIINNKDNLILYKHAIRTEELIYIDSNVSEKQKQLIDKVYGLLQEKKEESPF